MRRRRRRSKPWRIGLATVESSSSDHPASTEAGHTSPMLLFSLLCAACFTIAIGYAVLAGARSRMLSTDLPVIQAGSPRAPLTVGGQQPTVLFRSTAVDRTYGTVMLTLRDEPEHLRDGTGLECDRVYFAVGRGLCLAVDRGIVTRTRALVFDDRFQISHEIPLSGIPSRARLSPSGRLGATTTFVSGHSYAGSSFSTETTILDVENGVTLGTLEEFTAWRGGDLIQAPDLNFWGVSFANDDERFYATLGTGGRTYLVEGSVSRRSVEVIHESVECPSLSPDESRVAFKRRVNRDGPIHWQPYVLDLRTRTETPLAETRTIDDQIEWLDEHRILYALPESSPSAVTHVWSLPADGSGQPELFLERAASPVVIRGTEARSARGGTPLTGG